jgi:tRNA dimethylallyltransferase
LQAYSAGQFVRDARQAIDGIRARGKLPLLVGGTMLYFRALRRGLANMPAANPVVRAAIDAEAALRGWPALHAELAALDPVAAKRIQRNDAQRIQRALEVHRLTGKTLTELHATPTTNADLTFAAYAWVPSDRERLYAAIEQRFHAMMRICPRYALSDTASSGNICQVETLWIQRYSGQFSRRDIWRDGN